MDSPTACGRKDRTMTLFLATLSRMLFLFSLILIGYLLVKCRILDGKAAEVLSKLENTLFVPALNMSTFLTNFTLERLRASWVVFVAGFCVMAVVIPLAILGARLCDKDRYLRRIFTYGLTFSNFGFMGNAVVSALFPTIFAEYLIFTLPFWILIQLWGIPALLIGDDGEKPPLRASLKKLINPMLIGMLIGMVIGILQIPLPEWIGSLATDLGACMSPIAMILTGITIACADLRAILKNKGIYLVTALRLLAFPLLGLGVVWLLPLPAMVEVCLLCFLAMPLGLNTVVVPAAYGRDTSVAAGMALVSHLVSCVTIPLLFLLMP